MKIQSKYKFIIWDWNGTIFDDTSFCVGIMNNLLSKRALPLLTIENYKEIFDFPVKNYYQKLGFDFDNEPFEKIGSEFINKYNKNHFSCKLHVDIEKLINKLDENDYAQFVLSAREETKLIEDLKHYGIRTLFQDVSGLNNHYANGKISIGKSLIQRNGINPENCILIGDTLHDAEVAAELKVDCLLIANGHHSYKKLKQINVPVFKSVTELGDYLFCGS
ncbi:MAG: HAD hydrolase-like protein [Bacteroidota bacterium]